MFEKPRSFKKLTEKYEFLQSFTCKEAYKRAPKKSAFSTPALIFANGAHLALFLKN